VASSNAFTLFDKIKDQLVIGPEITDLTAIIGVFDQITIGFWVDGVEILFDPYTKWILTSWS
jgi:hypothetical protein